MKSRHDHENTPSFWRPCASQVGIAPIPFKKKPCDFKYFSVVVFLVWVAAFCFTPISKLQAYQQPNNDEVVGKLIALLSQYHGMEFQVDQVFVAPNSGDPHPTKFRGLVSSDGTEALVERSYDSSEGVKRMAYYGNKDYAYTVNCTPTNVFFAFASTKPQSGRSPFVEIGHPLIFFFGRTLGGRRLSDFLRDSKPVVTELSLSGDSRLYAVNVESIAEGMYRFEVSETEKSFQLTSVLVEETPESISAKNGQSIQLIRSVVRKRRSFFKDIEMQNGKITAFSVEAVEDELPSGKMKQKVTNLE